MTNEWTPSRARESHPATTRVALDSPLHDARGGPYRRYARGLHDRCAHDDSSVRKDALVVLAILVCLATLGRLPALWNALGELFLGWP